jgi:hypothetical protein
MRFTPLVFKGYGVAVLMVNNQKPGTNGRFSARFEGEEKDGGDGGPQGPLCWRVMTLLSGQLVIKNMSRFSSTNDTSEKRAWRRQ